MQYHGSQVHLNDKESTEGIADQFDKIGKERASMAAHDGIDTKAPLPLLASKIKASAPLLLLRRHPNKASRCSRTFMPPTRIYFCRRLLRVGLHEKRLALEELHSTTATLDPRSTAGAQTSSEFKTRRKAPSPTHYGYDAWHHAL